MIVFGKNLLQITFIPRFDVSESSGRVASAVEGSSALKDVSYYSGVLLGRNIFKPVDKEAFGALGISELTVVDMAKNLKLAGLAWVPGVEDRDRFTMIEDTDAGVTYFLKKGGKISSFSVEDILDDSVILSYNKNGEEIKLR